MKNHTCWTLKLYLLSTKATLLCVAQVLFCLESVELKMHSVYVTSVTILSFPWLIAVLIWTKWPMLITHLHPSILKGLFRYHAEEKTLRVMPTMIISPHHIMRKGKMQLPRICTLSQDFWEKQSFIGNLGQIYDPADCQVCFRFISVTKTHRLINGKHLKPSSAYISRHLHLQI